MFGSPLQPQRRRQNQPAVRMLCTLLPPTSGSTRHRRHRACSRVQAQAGAQSRDGAQSPFRDRARVPVQTDREHLELRCGPPAGSPARPARGRPRSCSISSISAPKPTAARTRAPAASRPRLDLASALVHSPDVPYLDEPTTDVDPASRLTVWEGVRRINRGGANDTASPRGTSKRRTAVRSPGDHRQRAAPHTPPSPGG